MTERYVSCTSQEDILVKGVKLQVADNKVEAVTVTDDEGNTIRITIANSYSNTLKVLKPEALAKRQIWVITGKLLGLAEFKEEKFNNEYEANARLSEIKTETGCYDSEKLGLKVEERSEFYAETKIT